jgi:hypothetical protein
MAWGPRTQALAESGKAPEPPKGRRRRVRRDPGAAVPGRAVASPSFAGPTRSTLARNAPPDCPKLAPGNRRHRLGVRNLPPKTCPSLAPAGEGGRGNP